MHDQFIAKILAAPDDDGPRLVYADALQAAGDPLGELVAVQCELARLGCATSRSAGDFVDDGLCAVEEMDSGRQKKLRARETAILKAHGEAWGAAVEKAYRTAGYAFVRGFIEHLQLDVARHSDIDEVFARVPFLRSLTLVVPGATQVPAAKLARLFRSSALSRIVELSVGYQLRQEPDFLDATTLTKLRALHVDVDTGTAATLARAPFFGQLEVLDATTQGIDKLGPDDALALVTAGAALRDLRLSTHAVGPEGARHIAEAGAFERLEVLSLIGNGIGPEGTIAIAGARGVPGEIGARRLAGLRALDLRRNRIGVEGAAALGAAFPALRVLDLTGNALREAGVRALVEGKGLGALDTLCLQQTTLDDAAVIALAAAPLLSHVRFLSLRSNKITDRGARALAASPHVSRLLSLNLNNNGIGEAGKKALKSSKQLERATVYVGR